LKPAEITYSEFLSKLKHYCALRERCCSEVQRYAEKSGMSHKIIEKALQTLKDENFVNEERYAQAYTHDKSKIALWGPLKIRQSLYSKGIPEALINQSLKVSQQTAADDIPVQLLQKYVPLPDKYSKEGQKIIRRLAAKGFPLDTILKCYHQVFDNPS
jgi:regulatory protein